MTTDDETRERIETLEGHIAHQDRTIQELSDVTLKQWQKIEELADRLERLDGQLRAVEDAIDAPPGAEPPPPHY